MKVASFSCHPSAPFLSSQCVTLGSIFFFLNSSVTRWNDTFHINIKKFTK
ncbi:hypothetical protein [Wolbachia endosymbiont (group A) of Anomoia purmunda]|nr:hypothetical protein [Wolbachia endosymbiont (group A) of Anomoia purmunda]